jgi:hypothetical protein
MKLHLALFIVGPLLASCAVSAATKIVTAPLRVAGKAVDLATTSQAEADRNRGRALRERDAKLDKLLRKRDRYARTCPESDTGCIRAREVEAEILEVRSAPLR